MLTTPQDAPQRPEPQTQVGGYEERSRRRYERLRDLGLYAPISPPNAATSQALPELSFSANSSGNDETRIIFEAAVPVKPATRSLTKDLRGSFEYSRTGAFPEALIEQTILLDTGCLITFDASPAKGRLLPQDMKPAMYRLVERHVYIKPDFLAPRADQDVILDGGLMTRFHVLHYPRHLVKPTIVEDVFATALPSFNAFVPVDPAMEKRINPEMLKKCKTLKCIHDKVAEYGRGSIEANVYTQLFRTKYYTTVGYIAWTYLPQDVRQSHLAVFTKGLDDPTCPMDAGEIILHVNQLLDAPHLGYDIEESHAETADFHSNNEIHQLMIDTDEALKYLMINGIVFTGNQRDNDVLQAVRKLLRANIGIYPKMDMMSKALMSWPENMFPTTSAVLMMFMADQSQYLRFMQTPVGNDAML